MGGPLDAEWPEGGQIDGFLSGNADGISDAIGGATDKLKGMFGGD